MPSGQVPVATGHPNQTDQPDKRMYHIPEPLISLSWFLHIFASPVPFLQNRKLLQCFRFIQHYLTMFIFSVLQNRQQNGPRWATVVVDEFLPCKISYGQPRPVFAEPLGEEIWVALLETLGSFGSQNGYDNPWSPRPPGYHENPWKSIQNPFKIHSKSIQIPLFHIVSPCFDGYFDAKITKSLSATVPHFKPP